MTADMHERMTRLTGTMGKLCLAVLCACTPVLAAADDPAAALALVRADEARRVAALASVTPAVVCIFEDRDCRTGGSGVVIDPAGYGLTNFHVVASFLESRQGYGGLSDGQLYSLRVVGIDPGGDIALFKLAGKARFAHAPLGDSSELRVGQWVAALGNPFALAEDYVPTATLGVISGLHRYQYGRGNLLEYADCIQVSTSINPGNSGGPIVDLDGRVVAIAGRGSFEERGRVNVGLGYGVPINQIRRFLPALRAGHLCTHGTLGATVQPAGDDLIFNAVPAASELAKAGVQLGDVLVALNGRPLRTPNELNNAIAKLPAGWPVTLTIRSGDREFVAGTRLAPLPLRDLPLFITELAQNHVEIRRVFELYEQAERGAAGRCARAATWHVRHQKTGGALQDGWPGQTAESEWQEFTPALLGHRELDVSWELLGGDEVAGRIASVVEHRPAGGPRIRWKFDTQTHGLVEVTVGDHVSWRPESRAQFGELRWPETWIRDAPGGSSVIQVAAAEFELGAVPTTQEVSP